MHLGTISQNSFTNNNPTPLESGPWTQPNKTDYQHRISSYPTKKITQQIAYTATTRNPFANLTKQRQEPRNDRSAENSHRRHDPGKKSRNGRMDRRSIILGLAEIRTAKRRSPQRWRWWWWWPRVPRTMTPEQYTRIFSGRNTPSRIRAWHDTRTNRVIEPAVSFFPAFCLFFSNRKGSVA